MKKEKIRSTDFIVSERPKTRFKQFFDIFKNQKLSLVKLSLLQTVFTLPLLVCIFIFWNTLLSTTSEMYFSVFFFFALSFIVTMPCLYIGMAGSFSCIKKICYGKGILEAGNFFLGIKEEWKKALLVGVIQGVINFGVLIGTIYLLYYLNTSASFAVGLGVALLLILFIVSTIMSYYSIGQIVTYQNNLRYVFKNSLIFSLIRFPINLLIFIIHPTIIIILIALTSISSYVAMLLIILFSSFGYLIWMLNVLFTFDKFINKEHYPDFYKAGLFIQNKED